jgi:sugar O-acyltransferase (sialic acid O-acetyltransferase NeuD family)
MTVAVRAPSVSVNEEAVRLVAWHKDDGALVRRGEVLCTVETSKAAVEVEAEADGSLRRLAEVGAKVKVGEPVATIGDAMPNARAQTAHAQTDGVSDAAAPNPRPWTKKAAIRATQLGIDIEALAREQAGRTVTEADVLAHRDRAAGPPSPVQSASRSRDGAAPAAASGKAAELFQRPERILLLGGGAGAGAMTVDVLARVSGQRAVAILDSNPATHGKTVGAVPILGGLDLVEELWRAEQFDSVIILFTKDIVERAAAFEALAAKGIPFANVIDPTAVVRAGVRMGRGNLVMGNVYFSTAVEVGDNNFFASHVVIEHHSRIGNHCTFGPRTTLSGAVQIGDRVKTGMAVAIEPYVTIAARSVIASGCVVTNHVPEDSLVKSERGHVVRPRVGA